MSYHLNNWVVEWEIGRPSKEGSGSMTSDRTDKAFDEEFRPIGTWVFVVGFAVLLFLLWFSVYLTLLSRGVTT